MIHEKGKKRSTTDKMNRISGREGEGARGRGEREKTIKRITAEGEIKKEGNVEEVQGGRE